MDIIVLENDKPLGKIINASQSDTDDGMVLFVGVWDGFFPWVSLNQQSNPLSVVAGEQNYEQCYFTKFQGNLNPVVEIKCA